MPRDGSYILSDLRSPTLSIVCEACDRRGRFTVAKLMAEHGDARLTDLLVTLTDCPRARSAIVHDPCKAVYGAAIAVAPARGRYAPRKRRRGDVLSRPSELWYRPRRLGERRPFLAEAEAR
jgi:hypothetical protein